jgi:hypothetical protein
LPLGLPLDTVQDQCPRNHVGVVTFADAVGVINGINCFACGAPDGLYDSRGGIEVVARSLVKR